MAATFRLQIITPERSFFDEQVEMVVFRAPDGEIGVMAGHAPMVVSMQESAIRIRRKGKWRQAAASDGFATITQDEVLLLMQTVEWPEEIDRVRAERDRALAEEKLRQQRSMHEYLIARSMLARAMVRLRVTGRNGG
ncbi:MAG: ATP synthase F1 subunit epsilon [Oscillospiraceae bacterium]|jgi:F-type H+-transporting ATPase subunit epsilon|nr:ATP synthase F1 subunit epsilon [Oscillospiraceae bacterium]